MPESVLLRYPCRLVSISYETDDPFHGDNTGSNPVGDANKTKDLDQLLSSFNSPGSAVVTIEQNTNFVRLQGFSETPREPVWELHCGRARRGFPPERTAREFQP
jgi:hypothetical protein